MKIREIVSALERFAPLPLQDGFDNAGLQIGLPEEETTGALLCLDVTESILDEALALKCNLIVSHHPLIFKPHKSITGKGYVERCILKAIKNDVAVYSAHTNLDNAHGGVNYKMASKIGLNNLRILAPKEESLLKLITFVPPAHADNVRKALFLAGCGHIGNYDFCSSNTSTEGTFRALTGANPFCGRVGELHREPETRIETILPAFKKNEVLRALVSSHPYEEPAYDLYVLQNTWPGAGAGVIGELDRPEPEREFLQRIKELFGAGCLKHTPLTGRPIQKAALCGGSGAFLLPAALRQKADVFITGEMKYHDYFGHENCIIAVEIGHYESEQFTSELLYSLLRPVLPTDISLHISRINTNPILYL